MLLRPLSPQILAVLAAITFLPLTSAQAAEWYASAHGGLVIVDNLALTDTTGALQSVGAEVEMTDGFGGAVAIGRGFRLSDDIANMRIEGEVSYRRNDSELAVVPTLGVFDLEGDLAAIGVMANAYYDFRTPRRRWTPYVGGGIGGASFSTNEYADRGDVVAYQAIAGLGYSILPRTKVEFEYRFFFAPSISQVGGGTQISSDYYAHNVFAGLRIGF